MPHQTFNLKIRRLVTNFIAAGVLGLLCLLPATASQRVALTWKPSPNPNVAGYQIYYGPASRTYTNSSVFGNVTSGTISGLLEGATYFFSATTKNAAGIESGFSNEASYTVPATTVNMLPTLNPIASVIINRNAAAQAIRLTGISSGAVSQSPVVHITASSSNRALIANPTITYTSPSSTGVLTFRPAANRFGTATITVTVNDGGWSNRIISQRFTVTVLAAANANAVVAGTSKSMNVVTMGNPSLPGNDMPTPVAASQVPAANESPRQISLQSPRNFCQSPQFNRKSAGSAPPAATLAAIRPSAKGQFSFQVTGVPTDTYVIQATDDLVHWFPMHTNTGTFIFTDTNTATVPRRFYRTVQPQS